MSLNQSFWNNKRIFLTGHTGFKGSWLILLLQSLGAKIYGFSKDIPTKPSLFEYIDTSFIKDTRGDITSYDSLRLAMSSFEPDIVIHLAAQSLVRKSYQDPRETYNSNIMGTVNVLDASRLFPQIRTVLIVTSDKCYENKEWHWPYREIEPMGGKDPYSSSKGCAELVTSAYRQSFFSSKEAASIVSVRAGNVIGGGDWAEDRLIPDCIRAFSKNEPLAIRTPSSIRPWQHVMEPLTGYLMLVEKAFANKNYDGGWNFGPDDTSAMPVSFIADTISSLWGNGAKWINASSNDAFLEAIYLKLDSSLAKAKLGWSSKWSILCALEKTVFWYKNFISDPAISNKTIIKTTLQQIEEYLSL